MRLPQICSRMLSASWSSPTTIELTGALHRGHSSYGMELRMAPCYAWLFYARACSPCPTLVNKLPVLHRVADQRVIITCFRRYPPSAVRPATKGSASCRSMRPVPGLRDTRSRNVHAFVSRRTRWFPNMSREDLQFRAAFRLRASASARSSGSPKLTGRHPGDVEEGDSSQRVGRSRTRRQLGYDVLHALCVRASYLLFTIYTPYRSEHSS